MDNDAKMRKYGKYRYQSRRKAESVGKTPNFDMVSWVVVNARVKATNTRPDANPFMVFEMVYSSLMFCSLQVAPTSARISWRNLFRPGEDVRSGTGAALCLE